MSHDLVRTPAKELTDEEVQERAELAFALDQEIKAGLRAGRQALWATAKAAHQFHAESGHTALGYDTFAEWLAQPDVGVSRATFNRWVDAYEQVVERRQLPAAKLSELDITKVQVVLPKVKTGAVGFEEAIEDAIELGRQDLRVKYLGADPRDRQMPDDDEDESLAGETSSPEDDQDVSELEVELDPDLDQEPEVVADLVTLPRDLFEQVYSLVKSAVLSGNDALEKKALRETKHLFDGVR